MCAGEDRGEGGRECDSGSRWVICRAERRVLLTERFSSTAVTLKHAVTHGTTPLDTTRLSLTWLTMDPTHWVERPAVS